MAFLGEIEHRRSRLRRIAIDKDQRHACRVTPSLVLAMLLVLVLAPVLVCWLSSVPSVTCPGVLWPSILFLLPQPLVVAEMARSRAQLVDYMHFIDRALASKPDAPVLVRDVQRVVVHATARGHGGIRASW